MEQKLNGTSVGGGKNLLIVDDDDAFRKALAEGISLMEGGVSVYTAENGEQAVAIIRNVAMDLVITDLRMPAMDGAELALWLAEDRPSVPVIVMSAYADSGMVRELEAKGNHFLDKPLDFNDLMAKIRKLLH
ncbi:MAG TPA: response regulator [Nitrospirota bacterium]